MGRSETETMSLFTGRSRALIGVLAGAVTALSLSGCHGHQDADGSGVSLNSPFRKGQTASQISAQSVETLRSADTFRAVVQWKYDTLCAVVNSVEVKAAGSNDDVMLMAFNKELAGVYDAVAQDPAASAALNRENPENAVAATAQAYAAQTGKPASMALNSCELAEFLRGLPDDKLPWAEPGSI